MIDYWKPWTSTWRQSEGLEVFCVTDTQKVVRGTVARVGRLSLTIKKHAGGTVVSHPRYVWPAR